jgi:hypothetical protein
MIDVLIFLVFAFGIYQWFKVIGMLKYDNRDDDPPPSGPMIM